MYLLRIWSSELSLTILVGLVLLGGIKRIGQVTEKLVPFMAVFYIVLALGVVLLNINHIPGVFASIIKGSFHTGFCYRRCSRKFLYEYEKRSIQRNLFQ